MRERRARKAAIALAVAVLVSGVAPVAARAQGPTGVDDSDAFVRAATRAPKPRRDIDRRVEALLAKMTIEEKVGQMTNLAIGAVSAGKDQAIQIDPAKIEEAVVKYGVGSLQNVNDQALTPERWHEIIGVIQAASQRTRLKIPVIYGIDTIHGANYVRRAALFPQQIGMGATWNPVLMQRAAEAAAADTRAAAIPWSFSPVLDVGRQPLWPRLYETFGEDTYLATVLGVAFVRGLEGDDIAAPNRVASCLKHYVGYSLPLNGRDRTPAWIPDNYMREYFLPPFAAAVKAGARTVMINSAEVNGVPGHVNKHLLTEVLRGELGFRGFVVSDWEDTRKLVTQWRVAADEKEAARMAIMAGIDMNMTPLDLSFTKNLAELVREGKVPMSRIDEAVRRILRVKFELGLFERPMPDPAIASTVGSEASNRLALEAARESMTLLKNDKGLLPLSKDRKILVTGPTADTLLSLNSGWTYTWQGNVAELYPKEKPTILQAIRAKGGKVEYVPGTTLDKEIDIEKAVDEAKDSDVVVACVGEGAYTETPGNITDLTLDEAQLRLLEALGKTGKPVVIVITAGRPRVISRVADGAGAILMAYFPGNEGGRAVADVLFGDVNPSGRLPFTWPRSPNSLLAYDHKLFETEETAFGNKAFSPQFAFGHGLSYTTFAYSGLRLSSKTVPANGTVGVSVTVANTGPRAGAEVVQLYVRDVVASLTPAGKRLRRFAKVYLEPGQSRTLSFVLRPADLAFVGTDNEWKVEPGEFRVLVGGLEEGFTLETGPRRR